MFEKTKSKAGAGIVIVAGSLAAPFITHEDLAAIKAVVQGPVVPGEPPHTDNEMPNPYEGVLDQGTVVGSTATAVGTPYGFTPWTPQS